MPVRPVPYAEIMQAARESGEPVDEFLRAELPLCWESRYSVMATRPSQIVTFRYGTFDYIFDAYQDQEQFEVGAGSHPIEARLVAAIGVSAPRKSPRDDGRLRGLVLSHMPGPEGPWDRGHFIAHAIGGKVDGNEANVFLQLRSVNRGAYRALEAYCKARPGTLCFSRPIYVDTSAHPAAIEFGILQRDGELRVELLPNRLEEP
jgi:hypothetical protein